MTEGKEEFQGFSGYLREVSAFSNRYSTDPLRFKFNNEEKAGTEYDSGVPLNFARVGRRYQDVTEIYGEEWDELRPFCRQLPAEAGEDKRQRENIPTLLEKISRTYAEPYFCELEFELTEREEELIRRQLQHQGTVSEEIAQTLAGEFYGDGYIATSEVGSFALIKRCKNAVKELNEGQGASPRLEQWLFDIHKARLPEGAEPVNHWQNPSINQSQKQAVEKILAAPDICLIQGPPGTGKTTVIAEAIWQLVLRGQRVLISSQANLAVDNALDRIVSDPRVRAIRLGNANKIDASVSDITEDHVLETFYHSLAEFVNRSYLKPWHESEQILEETKKDQEAAGKARETIRRINREIGRILSRLEEVRKQREQDDAEERLEEALGERAVLALTRDIKSYQKKKMRRELGGISLEEMVENVSRTAVLLKQEIQRKKESIAREKELLLAEEEELQERLKAQEREKEEQEAAISAMLAHYPEYKGSLEQRIQEKNRRLLGGAANPKVKREDWEEIFEGLTQWVEEIPDYAQEREIYLKDFINGCNVVGVSCTENGRTLIENGFDQFDVAIIDEVSKATPPELLIPMLRGKKVVLVGDHRQLPPLFNEHETSYLEAVQQYEGDEEAPLTMEDFNKYKDMVTSSLFERYFNQADPSIKETLAIQYRMHPDIMEIINLFYGGQLQDGNQDRGEAAKSHGLRIDSVEGTPMIVPERHAYWFDSSELLGKMVLEQRREGSSSAENLAEAQMILELLRKVELAYREMNLNQKVTVGVISFYFDQVALIRRLLRSESFYAVDVEVNTVDRFQGKEKEIIFVSLVRNVRSAYRRLNSHIAAFQRINVAFSRAQNLLVIVGARNMYADQPVVIPDLNTGEERTTKVYRQIIENLNQKNAYFTGDDVIPAATALKILEKLG